MQTIRGKGWTASKNNGRISIIIHNVQELKSFDRFGNERTIFNFLERRKFCTFEDLLGFAKSQCDRKWAFAKSLQIELLGKSLFVRNPKSGELYLEENIANPNHVCRIKDLLDELCRKNSNMLFNLPTFIIRRKMIKIIKKSIKK
jgi:hypothetical protein